MRWFATLLALIAGGFGLAGQAAAQNRELNLFAWSEYVPQGVIDGFTAETGIKVNYETYASNEEMLSKLLAGATKYDLVLPSEYAVEALLRQNALEPLDHSKLTNLGNLDPEFTRLAHDPGNRYSVPWMAGTVGIVVNTDKIKDTIRGYNDVFQDRFRNRIVILDDGREMVTWALATLGIGANDITDENLEKARPILRRWLRLVKVFDSDSPKTSMLNGDTDIGIVWSGEAALLYAEDPKFQYILPIEGTHQFIDSLAIPKGAPNREAAHRFINYILRPEVSKLISDDFPYTNPNAKARELLSEEQRSNPASYPPGNPKLETFRDIGEMAGKIDKLITELKSEL
ncbi:MAG: spermidine/putrescine ABC transporter substrate-binding protein [Phycisphaerae bacterium]|nr:spermidine/putrescine ABC transporter substrate-binding protein [Phycisphaerae bacterium]MDW8261434.1 spermidine/putrescine ABC transporter substrate-binding protein [Phycisphaerales bacterium]